MNKATQIQNLTEHFGWLRDQLTECHNRIMALQPYSIEWDEAITRRNWLRLRIAATRSKLERLMPDKRSKDKQPKEVG